jgi:hypothetical protein
MNRLVETNINLSLNFLYKQWPANIYALVVIANKVFMIIDLN